MPSGAAHMLRFAMRRHLIMGMALVGLILGAGMTSSAAVASPGWSAPADFPVPGKPLGSAVQIGFQTGGIATVAYLELTSSSPLQTVLHVGVIPPGGSYEEQLQIPTAANSIPADVKFVEAPDGAAVLEWAVLQGEEPEKSPLEYLASYRAAGSSVWETATTIASDASRVKNINDSLVPAISANGTAAAGVEHLDPELTPAGYKIDVAVHPPAGAWGATTQLSPSSGPGFESSESLALGFDASGDLTAAFRLRLSNERYTLAAKRRPASSGVWGSLEDVTGSDVTSDAEGPALGVGPDGSAVIAFQYVHYASPKTLDANAVTRAGATGPWSGVVDVAPGGASSGPQAAGVSPDDKAYVLYRFQGMSSGESCTGVVRAVAGGTFFSGPQCVSPTNFESGFGGVAFLGNDAYFAWSGQPNGGSSFVAEGSRWLDGSLQPDSFTDLDAPGESIRLDQIVPDEDGSVAAFWSTQTKTESKLRAAAFDAGGPNLLAAGVPTSATVGQSVAMSASFADLWSGLGEPPSWSFGDGSSGGGALVSHTYSAPGVYTVTVTARDGLGNQTSSTYSITVIPGIGSMPALVSMLTLLSSKVAGQGVVAQLGCTGGPCTGEAVLTTREKLRSGKLVAVQSRHAKARTTYRNVVVGVSHFTLAPGQTVEVSVALNTTGRKLLARFKKLPVTLDVTAKTTIATKRLTILPPKHSGKHKKH
jgi:hypothetical protein